MVDILVLGATGFTGRLVTHYLYNHPQRAEFTFALGVRSIAKGEALKKSLGLDDSVQLVQLDVTNYDQLEAAVQNAKVVINVVGPYWAWGSDVVKACALHGKRYVDLAGEPHFIRKIIDSYDYLATKTGAMIVPSCGMDSLPADITVFLSNRTLKRALGPETELGLSQTFYAVRTKPSGGTLATVINSIEGAPRVRVQEAHMDYALSPVHGHPSPPPTLAARVPFSAPAKYGVSWVMGAANRAVVQRTFGLTAFAYGYARTLYGADAAEKQQARLRPLTYGPRFRYAEYLLPGDASYLSAVVYGVCMAAALAVFYVAPLRWLVKKFIPKSGEGQSDEEMEKGFLEATNYTETASSPRKWAKSVMHAQGDPGYLLTASMIAECALGLLLDDADLPETARTGGVLTPATALGEVVVRRLEKTGRIRFESELVEGAEAEEESRKER